jgi:hypothetical protein
MPFSRGGLRWMTLVESNYNKCCRQSTINVEKDHLRGGPFYVQQTHPWLMTHEPFSVILELNKQDFSIS